MAEAWRQWEGQTVNGEFHLGEYLGGSQHSAVFQTQFADRDPQKAAIKLVGENSPNAESLLARWQFASTLSHPNLIRILQAGHCRILDAKLLYVVMEYAEENLSHIIPHRPLTENESSEMLSPALDALAYLHAKGLVHGGIKPANIMASGDQLKLSTDGLHRAGDPISDPSDYDPPETTSFPTGDVWSIGMTLVEVLTQRLPSWDRNAPRDPDVPETLPAPLLDIARGCLRCDPAHRWTVTDIANRLSPPVAAQRTEQAVPRNVSPKSIRYLIAAVILFLASIGFASLKLLKHSPRRDAHLPKAAEKPSEMALPERQQDGGAAPFEHKSPTPSEEQSLGGASQMSLPSPSAQARKAPEVGTISSGVIHQVLPNVPQGAMDTIRGTVRVGIKVSVDASGNVADATIDSPGPSSYFANLALQAAQQWKFAPARGTSGDWTLRFEFSADGIKALANQSAR
jgi:TonB family protein